MSLLPLPEKLLDCYSKFLNEHDLLNPRQEGFRKGCSTTDLGSRFTDDIFENLNTDKCIQYT